jgi:multidrug resistance protein, MATE family
MKNQGLISSIFKLSAFALPISLSALVNTIASFAAMMMVAKLGETELAAGALAVPTYITFMTVSSTIFYAVGILIGHYRGQQKSPTEIGRIFKNGCFLAIFIASIMSAVLWHADVLLKVLHQDPVLIAIAQDYFHYAGLSLFPLLMSSVIAQFYTGIGKPKFSLIMSVSSLPFALFLAYLLVLGHAGFPQMGLSGVMCGSMIVQSIFCIGAFIYMIMSGVFKTYAINESPYLPNMALCGAIFNLGMPISVQFGAEIAAMTASSYLIGYFGITALAAAQIVSQYSMLVVMLVLGLSQAVSVLVSEAYGREDHTAIREYVFASLIILTILFAGVFVVFFTASHSLVLLYLSPADAANQTLLHLAASFFIVSAFTLLIDGVRNVFSGALRGLHDSKTPMRIGVMALWGISLPCCYAAGFLLHGGPVAQRIGFLSGFIVATVILYSRIRRRIQLLTIEKNAMPTMVMADKLGKS